MTRAVCTVLAFDFGLRRIGLAVGDTVTRTAHPRPAVSVGPGGPDWARIGAEVASLRPGRLVVGTPYNADGSPGRLAAAARAFGRELGTRFGLPVHEVDEHGSSLEASAVLKDLRAGGLRGRRVRREDVDSAAAAVILRRWLERGEVQ